MAVVVLAIASLVLWAFAALVAVAGIAVWHDEGAGATAALLGIAALSAYPAWLFSRAAVRISRRKLSAPPQVVLLRAPLAIGGFLVAYFITKSVALGMVPVFVALAATALDIAQRLEPRKRTRSHEHK